MKGLAGLAVVLALGGMAATGLRAVDPPRDPNGSMRRDEGVERLARAGRVEDAVGAGRVEGAERTAGARPSSGGRASAGLGAGAEAREATARASAIASGSPGAGGEPGGVTSLAGRLAGGTDPATDAWAAESFACLRPLRRDGTLERSLAGLATDPRLRVGAFVLDPKTGRVGSVRGDESFAAASTIKVPIAVELLLRVDRGEIALDEKLVMHAEDRAGGSGSLQWLSPGLTLSVKRTAELMVRRSDNTATNMIIARLGGMEALNARFAELGLGDTLLRNPLPDMLGTNRTSPHDLVSILSRVTSGSLLSSASRELLFSWMRRSHVKSLLPSGLGKGAVCYNKTGDIPGALGDAGVVLLPGGRRYIAAIQVERPHNSRRANEMIRRLSKALFQGLL